MTKRRQVVGQDRRGTAKRHAKLCGEQFAFYRHLLRKTIKNEVHVDFACDGHIEALVQGCLMRRRKHEMDLCRYEPKLKPFDGILKQNETKRTTRKKRYCN
jgi:hypothetical protein